MIHLQISLAVLSFLLPGSASSFVVPPSLASCSSPPKAAHLLHAEGETQTAPWAPQDLTADNDGCVPIPDDDYVKQYQRNPTKLWPVEFFVVAHRRNAAKSGGQTEILVRRSANGTSKYGLGTGVPATRWMLSTADPPGGYEWSVVPPTTTFSASGYPEYDAECCGGKEDWTYRKIDMREDALGRDTDLGDVELEDYATAIRNALRQRISGLMEDETLSVWETTRLSVVHNVLEKPSSVAAIQGSLRMSGLFARRTSDEGRYLSVASAPDASQLAQSMRIYTMFPQMPDPMPPPTSTAEELKAEIQTRPSRMAQGGRDPHKDKYGRAYTHISTNNVSNTIHGIYLSLDVTGQPGLDRVPALDLLGTRRIAREWVTLRDLGVLNQEGGMGDEDTKPTFISGFIVRELVKEGVVR
mmetsp:Transcript_32208/g.94818  ORF Transcript_32208/g.94818 Transcript_32208/m.94818 type:complete len:413 (-) Transcript_32208:181-1419(-)